VVSVTVCVLVSASVALESVPLVCICSREGAREIESERANLNLFALASVALVSVLKKKMNLFALESVVLVCVVVVPVTLECGLLELQQSCNRA
jgi:hypothetical protein